jgi:hypothetical protein
MTLAQELRAYNTGGVFPGVDQRMRKAAEAIEALSLQEWEFDTDGDDVMVKAPNAGPGFKWLSKGGRRERRLLHMLVRAIVQRRRKYS